jgi:hypothetical protein
MSTDSLFDDRPTGDEEDVQRLRDVLAAIDEENDYAPALLVVGWTEELTPLLVRCPPRKSCPPRQRWRLTPRLLCNAVTDAP